MKQHPTIQKFIAAMLLLIFSISVAPKAYFHDLIAHHKDYSNCNDFHKNSVLHKEGYNCHFDDLVVSTPFTVPAERNLPPVTVYFDQPPVRFCFRSLPAFIKQIDNRGPPAIESFLLS